MWFFYNLFVAPIKATLIEFVREYNLLGTKSDRIFKQTFNMCEERNFFNMFWEISFGAQCFLKQDVVLFNGFHYYYYC